MKIITILLCSLPFLINAMDNNNNAKVHFAYENDHSYITYESTQDKDICVLNISSQEWEEKPDMTFVHKKGIPINEINALNMLGTNEKDLLKQMEETGLRFLHLFSSLGTFRSSDSSFCKKPYDMKFKKPQVRILHKERINQESKGIFGQYVDTNFLRVKVDTTYSLIYDTNPEKSRKICLYFYLLNQVNGLEVFPYKAKLVDSYVCLLADKEVRYF